MMDPQRIEAFRRKLREGREVRVIKGDVHVEGEGGTQPAPAGSPAADARAQGVRVKPHEWGAAAEAQDPFYASPAGEGRALAEQALLDKEYPGFELDLLPDGTPFVHGRIGPTETLRDTYHVVVELPPGYGSGVMPVAFVLEPPLKPGAPHRFQDGTLCLDHSGAFTHKSTVVTLLAWVSVWLVLYEGWLETGVAW